MCAHTKGANSSSGALKSGVGSIAPGCNGETRRSTDFAPFTVRAAAWPHRAHPSRRQVPAMRSGTGRWPRKRESLGELL